VDLTEIDLYDPDGYVDGVPHEMFATLRREAPVFRHPHPSGRTFWCVTRHADMVAVNRDPGTFSSWERTSLLDAGYDEESLATSRMMMLNMDPLTPHAGSGSRRSMRCWMPMSPRSWAVRAATVSSCSARGWSPGPPRARRARASQ
jgi:hypothetical protein